MNKLRVAGGLVVLAVLAVGCSSSGPPTVTSAPSLTASTPPMQPAATTPTAAPTGPAAYQEGPLAAGTYVLTPFTGSEASGVCFGVGCVEDPRDDAIRVSVTIPAGFEGTHRPLIWGPDGETGLIILRGASLYSDPCHSTPPPDIAVGPTVDDFATAIEQHPLLDATAPVAVTLGGYAGRYIDLTLPADIAQCTNGEFWPWEPGIYAQGPSHRWHLWILDVDGVRVVIQAMDYDRVSADRRAELRAIVSSIQIEA